MPAIAVTGFLGFLAGWTEFYFVVDLPQRPDPGLHAVAGAQQDGRRVRTDALVASSRRSRSCSRCPVSLVFFFFQRYIVGGLAVGGVKG